jgi:hypothetical protein
MLYYVLTGCCLAGLACLVLVFLQLPPLRVVPMGSKGWGVVAQQDIPAGAFVAEYLGGLLSCLLAVGLMHLSYFKFLPFLLCVLHMAAHCM